MRPIDYFDTAAALHPREIALVDQDVSMTFTDLRAVSESIASALATLAPAGEPFPVAVYSPNDYRVITTMLGIMRAGAVMVPIHARNTLDTNVDVLARIQPTCVLYHSSVAADVQAMKQQLSVAAWVCLDRDLDGDPSLERFIAPSRPPVVDWGDIGGNSSWPVYFWQTSGTTGRPKIVVDDCGTFDATLRVTRVHREQGRTGRFVSLAVSPLSHAGGCHAFAILTHGGTVVVMRSFDATEVLKSVERHRVTDVWLPPTALALLLSDPNVDGFDLSSLKAVGLGAAAVAPATLREAVAILGPCVSQTYGQIESGVVTLLDAATVAAAVSGDRPERLMSSGRGLYINRWGIMSEDGELMPPGQTGEIVVRGRSVKRYLDPEQTAEARRHGWHHTGDLGCVDEAGFLYVVGRKKDIIITSGFKVVAAEVEQTILELPDVYECAVVAAPDLLRGEAVKAIVAMKPGRSIGAAAILAHCRMRLPRGKAPLSVEQWPELPKSAVGKIDKQRIRDRVWAEAASAPLRGAASAV